MREPEPVADGWDWLDALAGPIDKDFVLAVAESPGEQERPALDLFDEILAQAAR